MLKRKLPKLKKLYKDEKTPIIVVGKILKNKEIDEIQKLIQQILDVEVDFDMPKTLGLSSIKEHLKKKLQFLKLNFIEVLYVQVKS